jgi:hypothetical protein
MKSIQLTRHAAEKLRMLRDQGYALTAADVETLVARAQNVRQTYGNRLVVQGSLDERHVLRVIYEETEVGVRVVTMYPGRRERYESKIQPGG